MADKLTIEQRFEQLTSQTAARAADLALLNAEKTTTLAVARAIKDRDVEHALSDHEHHLEAINGSQRAMADSLSKLASEFEKQTVTSDALAKHITAQTRGRFSRLTLITGVLMALAAWGSVITAIIVANS